MARINYCLSIDSFNKSSLAKFALYLPLRMFILSKLLSSMMFNKEWCIFTDVWKFLVAMVVLGSRECDDVNGCFLIVLKVSTVLALLG